MEMLPHQTGVTSRVSEKNPGGGMNNGFSEKNSGGDAIVVTRSRFFAPRAMEGRR